MSKISLTTTIMSHLQNPLELNDDYLCNTPFPFLALVQSVLKYIMKRKLQKKFLIYDVAPSCYS